MKYNRQEILEALNKKGANKPCHRCGHEKFSIIDGFTRFSVSEDSSYIRREEKGAPVILVGCANCGAITPHGIYALTNSYDKDND
jgi:transcription elongation factor Elf1